MHIVPKFRSNRRPRTSSDARLGIVVVSFGTLQTARMAPVFCRGMLHLMGSDAIAHPGRGDADPFFDRLRSSRPIDPTPWPAGQELVVGFSGVPAYDRIAALASSRRIHGSIRPSPANTPNIHEKTCVSIDQPSRPRDYRMIRHPFAQTPRANSENRHTATLCQDRSK